MLPRQPCFEEAGADEKHDWRGNTTTRRRRRENTSDEEKIIQNGPTRRPKRRVRFAQANLTRSWPTRRAILDDFRQGGSVFEETSTRSGRERDVNLVVLAQVKFTI